MVKVRKNIQGEYFFTLNNKRVVADTFSKVYAEFYSAQHPYILVEYKNGKRNIFDCINRSFAFKEPSGVIIIEENGKNVGFVFKGNNGVKAVIPHYSTQKLISVGVIRDNGYCIYGYDTANNLHIAYKGEDVKIPFTEKTLKRFITNPHCFLCLDCKNTDFSVFNYNTFINIIDEYFSKKEAKVVDSCMAVNGLKKQKQNLITAFNNHIKNQLNNITLTEDSFIGRFNTSFYSIAGSACQTEVDNYGSVEVNDINN